MSTSQQDAPMRQRVEEFIPKPQDDIVGTFEKLEPNAPPFKRDCWLRPKYGCGLSCVFAVPTPPPGVATQDTVIERAYMNSYGVRGMLLPPAIKQMRTEHSSIPDFQSSLPFFACVSLVIHPSTCMRCPCTPTTAASK